MAFQIVPREQLPSVEPGTLLCFYTNRSIERIISLGVVSKQGNRPNYQTKAKLGNPAFFIGARYDLHTSKSARENFLITRNKLKAQWFVYSFVAEAARGSPAELADYLTERRANGVDRFASLLDVQIDWVRDQSYDQLLEESKQPRFIQARVVLPKGPLPRDLVRYNGAR